MTLTRRDLFKATGAAGAALAVGWHFHAASPARAAADDPLYHVLQRATWGVRPADLERIRQMGAQAWIDWQLDYESIPDPLVDEFISARRPLRADIDSLSELAERDYGAVITNFLWGRIYRAIYSERQLYERMVEFWTDHFNVPAPDYLAQRVVEDREVIRKHALGKFRDLLFASATSPAMLDYLDQAVSSKEHPNENYAREIMELHTLGVDGGYTQADVVALARALTGWTLTNNSRHFRYVHEMHDTAEKTLLGVTMPAGRGSEDGLQAIDILARHPSTARFIARKLSRRFISDQPPQSIIESTAQVFLSTDGDLRAVMRHLLTSAEFMASAGQKFRRPLEYMVAMARVLSPALQVTSLDPFYYYLEALGHLPYHWFPPNGYPDVADAWITTNGMLHRWNAALEMAHAGDGMFIGGAMNLDALIPPVATVGELVDAVSERLLGMTLNGEARDRLIQFVIRTGNPQQPVDARLRDNYLPGLVGLVLASPYFQWS